MFFGNKIIMMCFSMAYSIVKRLILHFDLHDFMA